MYLPNADLEWGGNPVTGGNNCLQIITNTITCTAIQTLVTLAVPPLARGQKPIGSSVTLVN